MSEKCLVVYYSKTGSTKNVAEAVAKGLGADICEINEQGAATLDASGYGLVVVGTPVHGMRTSLPIQAYLTANKEKLGRVAYFATYGLLAGGTFGGMEKLTGKKPVVTLSIKGADAQKGKLEKVDGFVAALKK
jgi:flavodoxin